MGYCVGTNDTSGNEDLTNCTSQRGMFTFNPVKIFESELLPGTTLSDLGINRDKLNAAVEALKVAYRAMFVTYCIGIGFTGLCILLGLMGFSENRLAACCNWISAVVSHAFLIAFLALALTENVLVGLLLPWGRFRDCNGNSHKIAQRHQSRDG